MKIDNLITQFQHKVRLAKIIAPGAPSTKRYLDRFREGLPKLKHQVTEHFDQATGEVTNIESCLNALVRKGEKLLGISDGDKKETLRRAAGALKSELNFPPLDLE